MWKLCNKCGKHKALWAFYRNKKMTLSVTSNCIECCKDDHLKRYHEKKEIEAEILKMQKEKYGNYTDAQIIEWNKSGYMGPQYKTLKTEITTDKTHGICTTVDEIDWKELRKIKQECHLDNMGFMARVGLQILIKLYKEEKTFPEWKSLFNKG